MIMSDACLIGLFAVFIHLRPWYTFFAISPLAVASPRTILAYRVV